MVSIRCVTQEQIKMVLSWFHNLNEYDVMMGDPGDYGFTWKRSGDPLEFIPNIEGYDAVIIWVDDETDTISVSFE